MYEIILTSTDLPDGCNTSLLLEELETALGYGVHLRSDLSGSTVNTITLTRRDGLEFSTEDETTIDAVAAAHDKEGETAEQWIQAKAQTISDGIEARYKSSFFKHVMQMTEEELLTYVENTVEQPVQDNYPGTYSVIVDIVRFLAIAKDDTRAHIVAELRAEEE
jgi:hypothetical protein